MSSEDYLLANPEWKMDTVPEILDGKNVADFIDPDIAEKLEALEREEEKLQAEGFYENDEIIVSLAIVISSDFNLNRLHAI
jgi:nucleolar GTP-binding protein